MAPFAAEIFDLGAALARAKAEELKAEREPPLGLLTPAEYRAISAAQTACRKANEARIDPLVAQIKRARGLL